MDSMLNAKVEIDPVRYTQAHRACLHDYHTPQGKDTPMSMVASTVLADKYADHLMFSQETGKSVLEGALRSLSAKREVWAEGALWVLAPLYIRKLDNISASADREPYGTTAELGVRAHSIAAYAFYKQYTMTAEELHRAANDTLLTRITDDPAPTTDPVESLVLAVRHANVAASLQFVSRAVLTAGFAFRDLADGLGVDIWHFKEFAPLWRALERRERQLFDKKYYGGNRRDGMPLPAHTVCGAAGCMKSLERLTVAQQQPCRGNCSWDRKPWYCSQTCRVKDWEHHRKVCKPPRMWPPTERAPAVTSGQRAREILLGAITRGPVTQVEIVPDHVNELDTKNGIVLSEWIMPSPYVPGKLVRYVEKSYV